LSRANLNKSGKEEKKSMISGENYAGESRSFEVNKDKSSDSRYSDSRSGERGPHRNSERYSRDSSSQEGQGYAATALTPNYSNSGYTPGANQGEGAEKPKAGAMEVMVDHNIEKAIKILKRKLIKEGLFKELKSRRYYEKPSERKKRKLKESVKKIRKDEARQRKNASLL
jgi:small subunit ribosomal protein S21